METCQLPVETMHKFGQQLFIKKSILMYELISFQSSTYGYNHVRFEKYQTISWLLKIYINVTKLRGARNQRKQYNSQSKQSKQSIILVKNYLYKSQF